MTKYVCYLHWANLSYKSHGLTIAKFTATKLKWSLLGESIGKTSEARESESATDSASYCRKIRSISVILSSLAGSMLTRLSHTHAHREGPNWSGAFMINDDY